MKKNDVKYILDILSGKAENFNKISDWYSATGFIRMHNISGAVYYSAKEMGLTLPQKTERILYNDVINQTNRNEIMRKYIKEIGNGLDSGKIRYAFLKGSVLSNANLECFGAELSPTENIQERRNTQDKGIFYREGERASNDIDILISSDDIFAVTKILKDLGFIQGYYDYNAKKAVELPRQEILSRRMNRGETAPLILKLNNLSVEFIEADINFSLGYLPGDREEYLNKMLDNAVSYAGKIEGGIRGLKVNDFFMHLILHQYKEGRLYSMVKRGKDSDLYKFYDLYLFLRRGLIGLNDIFAEICRYGLQKEAYEVLYTLNQLFDVGLDDFLTKIQPENTDFYVTDPSSGKNYEWTKGITERLAVYDGTKLLRMKK